MVTVPGEREYFEDWPVDGAEVLEGETRVYFASRTVAKGFARAFGGELTKAVWEVDLSYQQSWSAMAVGRHWWLRPPWDTAPVPAGRLPLTMQTGLVFGGGDHATTQAMLELMETAPLANRDVFDLGTGTGILSEAAVLLGARQVFACDTDTDAAQMAKARGVAVFHGPSSALRDAIADVLLVNIPGYVHLDLAPEYRRLLRPQGALILSGYYEWQAERIEQSLGEGFRKEQQIMRGDAWVGSYFKLSMA